MNIGAIVNIRWLDNNEEAEGYFISFDEPPWEDDTEDDDVFYYAQDEEEVKSLMTEGAADFVVTSYKLVEAA